MPNSIINLNVIIGLALWYVLIGCFLYTITEPTNGVKSYFVFNRNCDKYGSSSFERLRCYLKENLHINQVITMKTACKIWLERI